MFVTLHNTRNGADKIYRVGIVSFNGEWYVFKQWGRRRRGYDATNEFAIKTRIHIVSGPHTIGRADAEMAAIQQAKVSAGYVVAWTAASIPPNINGRLRTELNRFTGGAQPDQGQPLVTSLGGQGFDPSQHPPFSQPVTPPPVAPLPPPPPPPQPAARTASTLPATPLKPMPDPLVAAGRFWANALHV